MRILTGGRIYTMDDHRSVDEAMAFEEGPWRAPLPSAGPPSLPGEGRIVAVGPAARLLDRFPDAEVVELKGRAVIPGFVDPHHHLSICLVYQGAVHLKGLRSVAEVQQALSEAAKDIPPGEFVVGRPYDPYVLTDGPLHRLALDEACPNHPVMLFHFGGHEAMANTRALDMVGYKVDTPDPPAGELERHPSMGLTGRLIERAMEPVEHLARLALTYRTDLLSKLDEYQQELFSKGIVRVVDPTVPPSLEMKLYRVARDQGRLRINVSMMPVAETGYLQPPHDRLDGMPTGSGEDPLTVGHIKLFMDGAERCAMKIHMLSSLAAAAEMMLGGQSSQVQRLRRTHHYKRDGLYYKTGLLYHTRFEAARFVHHALERGFIPAIHAIGNDGVERALEAMEAGRWEPRLNWPMRIEHACFLNRPLARRMADQGVAAVVQPGFLPLFIRSMVPVVPGLVRLPLRMLREAGALVAFSSDAPVTVADPLEAIRYAVNRYDIQYGAMDVEEAVDPLVALAMHTRNAAHVAGAASRAGTLEPGKRADFVILSRDPFLLPHDRLDRVTVDETVIGGQTVFSASAVAATEGAPSA